MQQSAVGTPAAVSWSHGTGLISTPHNYTFFAHVMHIHDGMILLHRRAGYVVTKLTKRDEFLSDKSWGMFLDRTP